MTINDKKGLLPGIASRAYTSLEIGCGSRKKIDESIGIDVLDYDGVDIVGNIWEVLPLIPDESIDSIYTAHFLEHIEDVPELLRQFARVLKHNASLVVVVPHFSNPYYFSDLTHRTPFGLYSFSYFSEAGYFRRQVPTYQKERLFSIVGVHLVFKASRPFYVRYAFRRIVGWLVNLSVYTKELYEDMFCYLLPCYEIRYELLRK